MIFFKYINGWKVWYIHCDFLNIRNKGISQETSEEKLKEGTDILYKFKNQITYKFKHKRDIPFLSFWNDVFIIFLKTILPLFLFKFST